MMTAPAIIRPKEIDTNIGPTSHSRRSNFWMLDILTAFLWREAQLSVTDSCQAWTVIPSPDSLCVTMSREIAKQWAANVGVRASLHVGRSVLMTRLRAIKRRFSAKSTAFVAQRLILGAGASIYSMSNRPSQQGESRNATP
jgi:hypothetical protein